MMSKMRLPLRGFGERVEISHRLGRRHIGGDERREDIADPVGHVWISLCNEDVGGICGDVERWAEFAREPF